MLSDVLQAAGFIASEPTIDETSSIEVNNEKPSLGEFLNYATKAINKENDKLSSLILNIREYV